MFSAQIPHALKGVGETDRSVCPAEEVRGRVLAQTGDAALVERLAPMQPGEAEAARRARLLYDRFSTSLGLQPALLPQVGKGTPVILVHHGGRIGNVCADLTHNKKAARTARV